MEIPSVICLFSPTCKDLLLHSIVGEHLRLASLNAATAKMPTSEQSWNLFLASQASRDSGNMQVEGVQGYWVLINQLLICVPPTVPFKACAAPKYY